jgi:Glycosyl hydrolase family 47
MESYFLAEAMKYFYLLFALPEAFDFETAVFNTEAHPICKSGEWQVGTEKRPSDRS